MADVKFSVGNVCVTSNADSSIPRADITMALGRYMQGDWGDINEDDKQTNEEALKDKNEGFIGVYFSSKGTKFWIITDYGRETTTVLLPEDY